MEGQKVQGTVRHDRDVGCADFADERRQQLLVDLLQPVAHRFEKLFGMNGDVIAAQLEFLELKSQTPLQFENATRRTKPANNLYIPSRNDECQHLISGREIFHK